MYTLATEQQARRRKSRDEWPVLVVDGGSFRYEMCRKFYFGSRQGGDLWSGSNMRGNKFLIQLMDWGWELIFVFDGISPEWKEATWRRTEADYVRADKDARGVAEWDDCLPPIFSGLVLSAALLKLGVATHCAS